MDTAAKIRANFKARDRLAGFSNEALREACDAVDDMMVIYVSEGCTEQAELCQTVLVDLVMEEERRNQLKDNK